MWQSTIPTGLTTSVVHHIICFGASVSPRRRALSLADQNVILGRECAAWRAVVAVMSDFGLFTSAGTVSRRGARLCRVVGGGVVGS